MLWKMSYELAYCYNLLQLYYAAIWMWFRVLHHTMHGVYRLQLQYCGVYTPRGAASELLCLLTFSLCVRLCLPLQSWCFCRGSAGQTAGRTAPDLCVQIRSPLLQVGILHTNPIITKAVDCNVLLATNTYIHVTIGLFHLQIVFQRCFLLVSLTLSLVLCSQ